MTNIPTHKVYFTECDDGTYLAASITTPLFCVAGETVDEAREKAQRALDYHVATAHVRGKRMERTVTQFTPSRIEELELKVA